MKLPRRQMLILSAAFIGTAFALMMWKQDCFHCCKKAAIIHSPSSKNLSVIAGAAPKQFKQVAIGPDPVASMPSETNAWSPSPLWSPSEEELREFPGAVVLEVSEQEGAEPGQNTHLRILKTHFKYPFIRTEELIDTEHNAVVKRSEMVADHLLVTLPEGEDPNLFLKKLDIQDAALTKVSENYPLYRLHLASSSLKALPESIEKIKAMTGIVAEPDFFCHLSMVPNDRYFLQHQWAFFNNLYGIHAEEAWNLRTSAASVIVALIDSGIRYTHEDLASNMWHNPSPSEAGDLYGWNASVKEGDPKCGDPMDGLGHGTHGAGTIGAAGNNGLGIAGVAWNVQLMACKFVDDHGAGVVSDAVICMNYASTHGASVVNCSWGYPDYSSALYEAMNRARTAGIIVVVAAGNSSSNNDEHPCYPANYDLDNIVTVTSTGAFDGLTRLSNDGPTTVHLAAPGENIYSTWSASDSFYCSKSGTSCAAPFVSGAFALLKAQFPMESHQRLIARLLKATDKTPGLEGKTITGGRLNLAKALAP